MSEEISAKSFFLLLWVVGAAILAWRAGTLKYLPAALVVSAQECTCANWPLHSSIIKLWALHSAPLLSIVGLPPAKNKLNAPQFPKVHIIICFIETLQELQMSLRFMVCRLGGTPLSPFVERFYSGFRKNGFDTLLRGKWKRFHQQFSFVGDLWSEHGVLNQRRLFIQGVFFNWYPP